MFPHIVRVDTTTGPRQDFLDVPTLYLMHGLVCFNSEHSFIPFLMLYIDVHSSYLEMKREDHILLSVPQVRCCVSRCMG